MKNTLQIYSNYLPKLANDFIYYAQCNPNKYRVITKVNYGIEVKVYKKPFNTLLFKYLVGEDKTNGGIKILRFYNRNHEYKIHSGKEYTYFYVYDENGTEVLEQELEDFEYQDEVNFTYEDFVRIYNYFLEDQGFFENENTLF